MAGRSLDAILRLRVLPSRRALMAVLGAVIALGSRSIAAQNVRAISGCYRFDRPWFSWVGRRPGDSTVVNDSTAVVRLSGTTALNHQLITGPVLDLQPLPFRADSVTRHDWLLPSGWKLDRGFVAVVWRNGRYGPVFRLGIRGDTLRGTVRFTTDVAGAERPPQPASAVRISCPRS
jgi:hypothetical protein